MRGVDLSCIVDFVCAGDTDEPQTIWRIAPVSPARMVLISCLAPDNSFALAYETFRFGVFGFEHFYDCDGNAVIFRTEPETVNGKTVQVVAQGIMEIIPLQVVNEVGAQILRMSGSVKAT